MRVDGEMTEEHVEDASITNHMDFERKWDEINWRWARILEFHVPGRSAIQDHREENYREENYREEDNREEASSGCGCCCLM